MVLAILESQAAW